jgi:hypothetical protein
MSTTGSWIGEMIQKFHLRENVIDDSRIDRFRLMMDRSSLPERMSATCGAINAQAGRGVIYQEVLLQPHPVTRRYTFENHKSITIMELAILFEGPGVVFSFNKTKPWVKRVKSYCGYCTEEKKHVVCKVVIDPAIVSDAEIQQWFTYLLSGLQNSFKTRQKEPSVVVPFEFLGGLIGVFGVA